MNAAFKVGNKIEQKPVLFDRCVRLDFGDAKGTKNKILTIEYNPNFSREESTEIDKATNKPRKIEAVAKGALCTRIEGTITDRPKINNKTRSPGFTATIKIYNDNGDIAAECAKRANLITDYATTNANLAEKRNAYQEFRNNKLWVTIYLGYWNGKNADYTKVFTGIVQSNYSYRKGVDLITELQCSDIGIDSVPQEQLDLMFDSGPEAPKTTKSEKKTKVFQPHATSWDQLVNTVIQEKSIYRTRQIKDYSQSTPVPLEVSQEDRQRTKWWEVDYDDPRDINLQGDALMPQNEGTRVYEYYSATDDFYSIWADILSIFPNGSVGCKTEDDYVRGVKIYHIYRLGKRKKPASENKDTYHIYDYQNLISTPSLGTNSGLNVEMILRPEIKAGNYIRLDLSTEAQQNLGVSIGVNAAGNSQFTSFLQGSSSQVAKSRGAKNGTIFNVSFLIFQVVHSFSTHSNVWKTSVTTVPNIFTEGS